MELTAVAELLGAQINIKKPEQAKGWAGRQAMLRWGLVLMFGGVAVGSGLKILGNEHIQVAGQFTPYLMVINLMIVFLGMGLICYPFLQMVSPRRPKAALPANPPATIKLAPELLSEEPSSVTEQTTEFLEAHPIRTGVRDTAPQSE
jgi:hypothetical protein